MGCRLFASTLDGLERNLTPAEMMKNYLAIRGSSKEERDELRASIAKMEEEQSK